MLKMVVPLQYQKSAVYKQGKKRLFIIWIDAVLTKYQVHERS